MTDKEIQEYYEYKEAVKDMVGKLNQEDLSFALQDRPTADIGKIHQERLDLDKGQVIHDILHKLDKSTKNRIVKRQILEQLLLLLELFNHNTDPYRDMFTKPYQYQH